MAYDERLAERIRALVQDEPGLAEKKMFGGLAFLIHGNLALAASGQGGLLLRVERDDTERLVAKRGAEPFEMRGRPMKGWLRVRADAVETDTELETWAELGIDYARSLPPKEG